MRQARTAVGIPSMVKVWLSVTFVNTTFRYLIRGSPLNGNTIKRRNMELIVAGDRATCGLINTA